MAPSSARKSRALNACPSVWLRARKYAPCPAGEVITWDDVELDEESVVVRLRRQQDENGVKLDMCVLRETWKRETTADLVTMWGICRFGSRVQWRAGRPLSSSERPA